MPFGWHPRDSPHSPLLQWTAILGREAARILSFSCLSPRALGPGEPSIPKPPPGPPAFPSPAAVHAHFFLSRKAGYLSWQPTGRGTELPFLRPPVSTKDSLKAPLIGFIQEEKKLPSFSCPSSHTKGWPSNPGNCILLTCPPPAPSHYH